MLHEQCFFIVVLYKVVKGCFLDIHFSVLYSYDNYHQIFFIIILVLPWTKLTNIIARYILFSPEKLHIYYNAS